MSSTYIDISLISSITSISLSAIGVNCRGLMVLNISECGNITDVSVSAVARSCPLLTDINISWCDEMTDVSLLAVAHGYPLLIEIILSWYDIITDVGVSAQVENCHNLKSMNTIRCGNISLNDLSLCKNYPRLRIVSAYDSNNLPLINTLN